MGPKGLVGMKSTCDPDLHIFTDKRFRYSLLQLTYNMPGGGGQGAAFLVWQLLAHRFHDEDEERLWLSSRVGSHVPAQAKGHETERVQWHVVYDAV